MSWPQDPLLTRVELQLGGTWTDVTAAPVYGREGGGVSITRGRQSEDSLVGPGRCEFEINNRDGAFSPRNPMSPYYGQIGRNTPVRVSVDPGAAVALYLPGDVAASVSTPDAAALDITGDLDVRFDATLENWWSGDIELCGKWGAAGQRSWLLRMADELIHFEWSADGTASTAVVSTVTLGGLPPSRRIAIRVTLDVNNGASGNTTTFYTADTISGPWSQFGDPVINSGTTSIFSSTAALEIGDLANLSFEPAQGRVHAVEVRNGINGTAAANPVFADVTSGATSFADAAGRTWTAAGAAELSGRRVRFVGEVSSWPTRWTTGGFDVWVPVEASGILRRLGQGSAPAQSALRRAVPSDPDLLAYWPCEDEAGATQAASPIEGVRPMRGSGVTFSAGDGPPGSAPLPTISTGGYLKGTVPAGSGNGWRVELVYQLESLPVGITSMWQVHVSGSEVARALVRASTTAIRIELRDGDETVLDQFETSDTDAIAAFIGQWNRLVVTGETTVTGSRVTATWAPIDSGPSHFVQTTADDTVCGDVRAVTTGTLASDYDGQGIGHIAAFDSLNASVLANAADGFAGESAINRMTRLAEEDQALLAAYDGDPDLASELMGPQTVKSFLDLVREGEAADGGILYERPSRTMLLYRDRSGMYDQDPTLTVPYSSGALVGELAPVDDDQHVRNDITVQRQSGSSARAVLDDPDEGPLNVLDPPDGVGIYADSVTLNLAEDVQAEQIARWLLHRGTWDEARYPQVTLHLAKDLSLIEGATRLDVGDVLRLTGLPDWLPPGPVDLMVQGLSETWTQHEWRITYNCTPAGPWTTAHIAEDDPADDAGPVHIDTDGSELDASVDTDDTQLVVLTTDGPVWVTSAGPTVTDDGDDLPFTIRVGGEDMDVTAVQPLVWDTYTRSVSNGWGSASGVSGAAWSTSGGTAAERSVSGTQGLVTVGDTSAIRFQFLNITSTDSELLTAVTVPALATGAAMRASLLMRVSGSDYYLVRLNLATSGAVGIEVVQSGTSLTGIVATGKTYTAATKLWIRSRIVGQTVQGRTWVDGTNEPGGWQVEQEITSSPVTSGLVGVTAARATSNTNSNPSFQFDGFQIVTPQLMTVTRSVNGVVKSHSDAADVRLAEPMIVAL